VTNVTGMRKLPRRMIDGTRLTLPVTKVTTTVAAHSPRPAAKIRRQLGPVRARGTGGREARLGAVCSGIITDSSEGGPVGNGTTIRCSP
jgi:hypothetical protein